jgi:hypothetical protein
MEAVARDSVASITGLAVGATDGAALKSSRRAHPGAPVGASTGTAAQEGPVDGVKRACLTRVAAPIALRTLGLVVGTNRPKRVAPSQQPSPPRKTTTGNWR